MDKVVFICCLLVCAYVRCAESHRLDEEDQECQSLLQGTKLAGLNAGAMEDTPVESFDIWAPHAVSVEIAPCGQSEGSVQWAPTALTQGSTGHWTATMQGMQPGDYYHFVVHGYSGPGPHSGNPKPPPNTIVEVTRLDPRGTEVSPGASCSMVPHPYTFKNPRVTIPRKDAIIYEMHVQSFTEQGTLDSARSRLPYLQQLGMNVIQLMPMSAGQPTDSWGYQVSHPFAVKAEFADDPSSGGSFALKRFVDEAAGLGMAVWLDIVWNHAFSKSMLANWDAYASAGPGMPAGAIPRGIYFYNNEFQNAGGWGPRFDFSNNEVVNYMRDNIIMYTDQFHLAGFRVDATKYIRGGVNAIIPDGWAFLQHMTASAHSSWGTVIVAEDTDIRQQPLRDDMINSVGNGGAGFDGFWSFAFNSKLQNEFLKGPNQNMNMDALRSKCLSQGEGNLFSESHDEVGHYGRFPSALADAGHTQHFIVKRTMLALSLAFVCEGFPMLLQGQEFLTEGNFGHAHGTPTGSHRRRQSGPPKLDWSLEQQHSGLVQMVRDLSHLRQDNATKEAMTGSSQQTWSHNGQKVFSFRKFSGSRNALVLVNLLDKVYTNPSVKINALQHFPQGPLNVRFNGDLSAYSELFSNSCANEMSVTPFGNNLNKIPVCIPPMSVVVLSP